MDNLKISVPEVLNHIKHIELPLRLNGPMGSCAEEVLRYGACVGSSIECHTSLKRAMNHARNHIDTLEQSGRAVESGRVILADRLTSSKGRFTRNWHAPSGGLWGCLVHANSLTPYSAMLLSLAVGTAACESIRQAGVERAALRWVNDVLIDEAKVAGFLIESHTGPVYGEQFHLVGFGINVNNRDFPDELTGQAASIGEVLGRVVDIKSFALTFIAKLVWNIGLLYYVEAKHLDRITPPESMEYPMEHPVINSWKSLSNSLGKRVVFGYDVVENPQYHGVVTGLAFDGGLQMTLDDGSAITEYSGEIRYL